MNQPARDENLPATVDLGLDELLDALASRIQGGEAVDLDRLLAAHPEHAAELQRVLPAMRMLAQLHPSKPGCAEPGGEGGLGQLGDFRLLREVGRGGMGIVYEALQES